MNALKLFFKGLLYLLALLLVALLGYALYAHIAWRDIPVATLEARYGGEQLRTEIVDGVPIRYRLDGAMDSGQALVVLIHNHFMDQGIWDQWRQTLAPHFTVLSYDLSGHGLTGPDPSGVYTVARDAELLDGLLRQLDARPAALVGSSLGGNVAFTYAAQQPLQALVLINSGGLKRPGSNAERDMPGWADWVFPLIPPAALQKFLAWMITDDAVLTAGLQQRFVEMWRRQGNRPAELARLRQYDTGNPDPLLAQINAPTLILWGADNPQLPVALADEFQAKLSTARSVQVIRYPGAGHVLPVERPVASARDSLSFLLTHLKQP